MASARKIAKNWIARHGRRRKTLSVALLGVTVALLVFAAEASAVSGLIPRGCIDDNDTGSDSCATSVDGLRAANSVALSADGRSLYATSLFDNAVVRFDRSTTNGALMPRGCIDDNDTGADSCGQTTNALAGVSSAVVSADGEWVYVASEGDDAITQLDRDPATGALKSAVCVDDNDTGLEFCITPTNGLRVAVSVAPSADGKSVYGGSRGDSAVVHLTRDPEFGTLTSTLGGCIDDNDDGPDTCAQSTNGLGWVQSVAVSADGRSVYAAGLMDSAIVRFDRNTTTGALTPRGCIEDNDFGPDSCAQSTDGLGSAISVAVSPDGRSVYAAGRDDDAIVRFDRSTSTGALTPRGCVDDNDNATDPFQGPDNCGQSVDGLNQVHHVTVSPGGRSVYAASIGDAALVRLERNRATGALSPAGCVDDNDAGPDSCAQSADGLEGARWVAASADGKSVYTAASVDDAIARFDLDTDPPDTTIIGGPGTSAASVAASVVISAKGRKRKARFKFKSDEAKSTFECKLDRRKFKPCGKKSGHKKGRKKYKRLKFGKHKFKVRAIDRAGNVDPKPAKAKFKLKRKR